MQCEHKIHKLITGQILIEEVNDDRKPCPECGRMLSITLTRAGMNEIVAGVNGVWIDVKEVDE
jgi:hypothetical protein